MSTKNNSMVYAIVFAAVVISGALVFLAYQMGGGSNKDLQVEIAEGIEAYVQGQQQQQVRDGAYADAANVVIEEGKDYSADDAFLGDKNAPVTMIEFSDYECPFCQRHFQQTYPKLEKYIDAGQLKIVFVDLVSVPQHDPWATVMANAANCAREQGNDETYFKYHDLLFTNTQTNGAGPKGGLEGLYGFADELGLDVEDFQTCVENDKYRQEVTEDVAYARSKEIYGTPSFLINGTFIEGANEAKILETIEAALK